MAKLAFDIQNYLRQQDDLVAMVGKSQNFPVWIWADKPLGKIEGYGKVAPQRSALIVITENNGWAQSNAHNTLRFPRVYVDVWADPTRNPDGSVRVQDADDKIDAIQRKVMKYLHLVDMGGPNGMPVCWGTAEQMATFTGSILSSSSKNQDPVYSDVRDGDGARMGTATYDMAVL